MTSAARLKVVLCWHMHQPWYWDPETGRYELPWTYLHAIKDYVDMAAHLEAVPAARAVFNFTPTLLEQLADYEARIAASLATGSDIHDPLLDSLRATRLPVEPQTRTALIRACLRAHEQNLIQRFPAYARLAELGRRCVSTPALCGYLNEEFLADLLVWYHLAWIGETVRADLRVQRLTAKESGYSHGDRIELLTVIGELIAGVIPRYRRLVAAGQAELSVTPYAHPIAPLLIDFTTARETLPDISLPAAVSYPGGVERARWHIDKAMLVFQHVFGFRPRGCWPAEGAVSRALLSLLNEQGFIWAATGQAVMGHSVSRSGGTALFQGPYRCDGASIACFYRDDALSDRIGFTYSHWHADDAVSDLISHLHQIKRQLSEPGGAVVPIIMDGENAWDHYAHNASYFLSALYRRLSEDAELELTTFSDCLEQGIAPAGLPQLVSGSWIYGTFSTWMGDPDKNRAWDLLAEAKHAVDRVLRVSSLPEALRQQVEQQLAICEGSDWFWWFGPHHARETVLDFDRLFRHQLLRLYRLIGVSPPAHLQIPVSGGSAETQNAAVMLPART
jgi:alpha-amylase/alpha-mannosidase (GH57 family)